VLIIHGKYRFGRRKIGARKDFCNACERECLSELWRSFDCGHLFWIPLLPLGFRERWLCTLCQRDPRARYRTGKAMLVAGMIAAAFFLAALSIYTPKPGEMDASSLWGTRIVSLLAFIGLLYAVLKPGPAVPEADRRKAVTPLSTRTCLYCRGPLTSQPHLRCPSCQVRIYT
jgi:hypothetical protein